MSAWSPTSNPLLPPKSLPRETDSVCRTLHVPIDTVLRSREASKGVLGINEGADSDVYRNQGKSPWGPQRWRSQPRPACPRWHTLTSGCPSRPPIRAPVPMTAALVTPPARPATNADRPLGATPTRAPRTQLLPVPTPPARMQRFPTFQALETCVLGLSNTVQGSVGPYGTATKSCSSRGC